MTAAHAKQLVDGYLGRLELELLDVASERRREIVDDIRAHIADERGTFQNETDADLMNLLDRLGDPAEIAAATRDGQSRPQPVAETNRVGVLEILALVLTPTIWPVGVILLWASSAWTTRQKLLGTLVLPGGYPAILFILPVVFLQPSLVTVCGGGTDSIGNPYSSCTGPEWWQYVVGIAAIVLILAALAAPVLVGIYLATRLRSRATS